MKSFSAVFVLGLYAVCAGAQESLNVDDVSAHDAVVTVAGGRGADIRVRVTDSGGKPVPGAIVSAVLPPMGVGGSFGGGSTIKTETTNSRGEAEFTGIRLRRLAGDFTARVLARSGNRTGSTQVSQRVTNAPPPPEGWTSRRRLVMLGVIGAGVAAGVVAATYDGSTPAPTVRAAGLTVTPGTPTTTGPR